MKNITEMTDEELCMYIYHKKGIPFSDGFGNKIYIMEESLEEEN